MFFNWPIHESLQTKGFIRGRNEKGGGRDVWMCLQLVHSCHHLTMTDKVSQVLTFQSVLSESKFPTVLFTGKQTNKQKTLPPQ